MLWSGAGVCLAAAGAAMWRERSARRRRDLDRIGPVDWRTAQMLALIGAAAFAILALHP